VCSEDTVDLEHPDMPGQSWEELSTQKYTTHWGVSMYCARLTCSTAEWQFWSLQAGKEF